MNSLHPLLSIAMVADKSPVIDNRRRRFSLSAARVPGSTTPNHRGTRPRQVTETVLRMFVASPSNVTPECDRLERVIDELICKGDAPITISSISHTDAAPQATPNLSNSESLPGNHLWE